MNLYIQTNQKKKKKVGRAELPYKYESLHPCLLQSSSSLGNWLVSALIHIIDFFLSTKKLDY